MTITEYGVLEGLTVDELRFRVEDHIKTGWQPLGGVAVVQTFTDYGTISRDCSGKYIFKQWCVMRKSHRRKAKPNDARNNSRGAGEYQGFSVAMDVSPNFGGCSCSLLFRLPRI